MGPLTPPPLPVTLVAGLDIGQKVDPSAICVAEQSGDPATFVVRYLGRPALGTPFPRVATRVIEVVRNAVTQARRPRSATPVTHPDLPDGWLLTGGWDFTVSVTLTVDITGLGAPVFELIERELADHGEQDTLAYRCTLVGASFTHGDRLTRSGGGISVGKAYLVSRLQSLIQSDPPRLALPRTGEAEVLRQELLTYEIRVSEAANDRYGAFKVGTHDDLVTALGLAVLEEHHGQPSYQSGGFSRSRPTIERTASTRGYR